MLLRPIAQETTASKSQVLTDLRIMLPGPLTSVASIVSRPLSSCAFVASKRTDRIASPGNVTALPEPQPAASSTYSTMPAGRSFSNSKTMRSHPPDSGWAPTRTSTSVAASVTGSGLDLIVVGSVEPGFCGKTVPSTGGTVAGAVGDGPEGVEVTALGDGAIVA